MDTLTRTADVPDAHPLRCNTPVLIVAHPGHELRVYGWMERARPLACVLTDGSGGGGEARIESTTRVLGEIGARPGPVYGRMSDREVYAAILAGEHGLFLRLADELAETLARHGADCVVGDAVEGYNPSHDVCRLVINTAVRMAQPGGATMSSWDFVLVGAPGHCPAHLRGAAVFLELDDAALERKLRAAHGYPELAGEVAAALERYGQAPFRTECLRPSSPAERRGWAGEEPPFYETFGEARVAEGRYPRVLRFREHVLPLADALWEHGERRA
jgi:hypothetical protein